LIKIESLLVGLANTAQNYGLLQSNTLTAEMLKTFWGVGLRKLDSAYSYNNANEIIKESNCSWEIQTKVKIGNVGSTFEELENCVQKACDGNNVTSLLVHDTEIYKYKKVESILKMLKEISLSRNIPKFGISIYRPIELERLNTLDDIDLIQFPHNPFDSNCLDWCIRHIPDVPLVKQVRSIFLQGLLTRDSKFIPANNEELAVELASWQAWLLVNEVNPVDYCLNFVGNDARINEIVIGVESTDQATYILKQMNVTQELAAFPGEVSENLTDPRRWNY